VAKDLENDIVFKSEIFGIKFKNAINASEQLVEEKKVIIEKIIADVEGIKEENTTQNTEMASIKQQQNEQSTKISSLETAISKITNYDDTELKSSIDTANDTLERIEEKINNINVGGSGTTEPSKTNEWQPEPDWWNIEEIINNDTEPYAQKIICLLSDGLDDKATVNQVKRWNKV